MNYVSQRICRRRRGLPYETPLLMNAWSVQKGVPPEASYLDADCQKRRGEPSGRGSPQAGEGKWRGRYLRQDYGVSDGPNGGL